MPLLPISEQRFLAWEGPGAQTSRGWVGPPDGTSSHTLGGPARAPGDLGGHLERRQAGRPGPEAPALSTLPSHACPLGLHAACAAPALPGATHLLLCRFRIFCTYSHSSRPTGSSRGRGRGAPYTTLHTAFSAKLRAAGWPSAAAAGIAGLRASLPAGQPLPHLNCWSWGCVGLGVPLPLPTPGRRAEGSGGVGCGKPQARTHIVWGSGELGWIKGSRGSAPSAGSPEDVPEGAVPAFPLSLAPQQTRPTVTLKPALGQGPAEGAQASVCEGGEAGGDRRCWPQA